MGQLHITFIPMFQPVNKVNQLDNLVIVVILSYCHAGAGSNIYLEGEGHYPSHVVSDYKRHCFGLCYGIACVCFGLCLLMEIGVCKHAVFGWGQS